MFDYESCVEGKIIKGSNSVEISILKSVAEALLAKNGYESIKTLVEKWRQKQILLCEKDRAYKRVKCALLIKKIIEQFSLDLGKKYRITSNINIVEGEEKTIAVKIK